MQSLMESASDDLMHAQRLMERAGRMKDAAIELIKAKGGAA